MRSVPGNRPTRPTLAPQRQPRNARLGRAAGLCALLLGVAAPAGADDFDDFRIPSHRRIDWSASFGSAGDNFSQNDEGDIGSSSSRGDRLRGDLQTGFAWTSDSDPAQTSIFASVRALGARDTRSSDSRFDFLPLSLARFEEASSQRLVSEGWAVGVSQRWYPWSQPLGLIASAVANGSYQQDWTDRNEWRFLDDPGVVRVGHETRSSARWNYSLNASTAAGLGWGRVRDATGVYEAIVLEDRLRASGALTRPLSAEARRRLAGLIYLRYAYAAVRQRSGRGLWADVERILEEDGALAPEGLDGFSVLRAGEPHYGDPSFNPDGLPRSPIARLRGFFVGLQMTGQNSHAIARDDRGTFMEETVNGVYTSQQFETHLHLRGSFDRVLGGGRIDYNRPIGPRLQLDLRSEVLTSLREQEDGVDARTTGVLSYLMADRWLARAGLSHSRVVVQREIAGQMLTIQDGWGWTASASALYFLEDRLSLRLDLTTGEGRNRNGFFGGASTSRSSAVALGLSYRFLGRFEAPGFLAPVNVWSDAAGVAGD